jgi:hypothetical protein
MPTYGLGTASGNATTRNWQVITGVKVDVAGNLASASVTAIPIGAFTSGGYYSPTIGAQTITVYVCDTATGTFILAKDAAGSAPSAITSASGVGMAIPSQVFGWPFLKIVVSTTAVIDVVVCLKS